MFCSVCLVAENVIMCYFWFCVCYESVWMMRKCRNFFFFLLRAECFGFNKVIFFI